MSFGTNSNSNTANNVPSSPSASPRLNQRDEADQDKDNGLNDPQFRKESGEYPHSKMNININHNHNRESDSKPRHNYHRSRIPEHNMKDNDIDNEVDGNPSNEDTKNHPHKSINSNNVHPERDRDKNRALSLVEPQKPETVHYTVTDNQYKAPRYQTDHQQSQYQYHEYTNLVPSQSPTLSKSKIFPPNSSPDSPSSSDGVMWTDASVLKYVP